MSPLPVLAQYNTSMLTGLLVLLQIAELCIYLALLADWSRLFDGSGAWQHIAALLGTVTLPILYSRRIVDFGAKEC